MGEYRLRLHFTVLMWHVNRSCQGQGQCMQFTLMCIIYKLFIVYKVCIVYIKLCIVYKLCIAYKLCIVYIRCE